MQYTGKLLGETPKKFDKVSHLSILSHGHDCAHVIMIYYAALLISGPGSHAIDIGSRKAGCI